MDAKVLARTVVSNRFVFQIIFYHFNVISNNVCERLLEKWLRQRNRCLNHDGSVWSRMGLVTIKEYYRIESHWSESEHMSTYHLDDGWYLLDNHEQISVENCMVIANGWMQLTNGGASKADNSPRVDRTQAKDPIRTRSCTFGWQALTNSHLF